MKYVIISQPKSGTYLCVNLLSELKINPSWMHFTSTGFVKFNPRNIHKEKLYGPDKAVYSPITRTASLITDNYFSQGHIEYNPITEKSLKDFKKILLTRDKQECIESLNRMREQTKRQDLSEAAFPIDNLAKLRNGVAGWQGTENTFNLSFNDMININLTKLDKLQQFLFDGDVRHNSKVCMENALKNNSITKSNLR